MSRFLVIALLLLCAPILSGCGSVGVHKNFLPNDQAEKLSSHSNYYQAGVFKWDDDAEAFVEDEASSRGVMSVATRGNTYLLSFNDDSGLDYEVNAKYVYGGWWSPSTYIAQIKMIERKKIAKKDEGARFLMSFHLKGDDIVAYYNLNNEVADGKGVKRLKKKLEEGQFKVKSEKKSTSVSFVKEASEDNKGDIITFMKSLKPTDYSNKLVLKPISDDKAEELVIEQAKKKKKK